MPRVGGRRCGGIAPCGRLWSIEAEGVGAGGEEVQRLPGQVSVEVFEVAAIGVQSDVGQDRVGGPGEAEGASQAGWCFGGKFRATLGRDVTWMDGAGDGFRPCRPRRCTVARGARPADAVIGLRDGRSSTRTVTRERTRRN